MPLVDRVRNICVSPATEWPVIEQERTEPADLTVSYLVPLALANAAAGFIGGTLLRAVLPLGIFGGFFAGIVGACVSFVMTLLGCLLIAFIINTLAATFDGTPNFNQAFKTSVYSYTPGVVGGIARIVPFLGGFVAIVASFYGLYLLYVGLPVTMRAPKEKAAAYTVLVVVASIVVMVVITTVMSVLGLAGLAGMSQL